MAKKFFGVKYGINPTTKEEVRNQIFETWKETESVVRKVKGAQYKGFETREEAEVYITSENLLNNKKDGLYPTDCLHCYVDGSYSADIKSYSFGNIYVREEKVIEWDYGKSNKHISMQQIGGELLGAMKALLYAKKNGHKKVVIFHDYVGVCYHAIGYWGVDNALNQGYRDWFQAFKKENPDMEIHFCKVDAHDKDPFNEMADGLAKKAVGIVPNPISFKMGQQYNVSPLKKETA